MIVKFIGRVFIIIIRQAVSFIDFRVSQNLRLFSLLINSFILESTNCCFFWFDKFFKGSLLNMMFFSEFGIQRIAGFFFMLENFLSEDLKVLQ